MFSKDSFPLLCDLFCFRVASIPNLHFQSYLASCLLVVYEWNALVESEKRELGSSFAASIGCSSSWTQTFRRRGFSPHPILHIKPLGLLASSSAEKSSFVLITVLHVMCLFSLATFNIFSLCYQFRHDVFRCSFLCIYPALGTDFLG